MIADDLSLRGGDDVNGRFAHMIDIDPLPSSLPELQNAKSSLLNVYATDGPNDSIYFQFITELNELKRVTVSGDWQPVPEPGLNTPWHLAIAATMLLNFRKCRRNRSMNGVKAMAFSIGKRIPTLACVRGQTETTDED